jgi:hypothetical protein
MPNINNRFLFVVIVLVVLWSAGAFAQEEKQPFYPQAVAVITAKYKGVVAGSTEGEPGLQRGVNIIASGVRYGLTDTTNVVGTDGEPITLDKLPVPCEAIIIYQSIRKNNSNVIEIRVKNVTAGATTAWTAEGPR